MTKRLSTRAALSALMAAALLGAGYLAGSHRATANGAAPAAAIEANHGGPDTGRKVLYWRDPMVPNQHFDKPGKSPFMDMQLEPVYADADGEASAGIAVAPGVQQSLGIRYASVRRRDLAEAFDAVGTTQFDESQTDVVQSRVTGYIDRLDARAPMQPIAKGAPVATLFVPDWLAPQEEYLALRRAQADASLLDAARARMRALSIPDGVIAGLDRTGRVQTHVVLSSPRAGVVTELNVRNGAMVAPGQTLAKVAGLSTLWLIVEIPEAFALRVRPGSRVDATFAGDPARHFEGRIREILPGIDAGSRTLQARLELDNAALRLTPGMLMRVRVASGQAASRLTVPSEAVITTGKRSVVIVRNGDGRLRPVEVTVGDDFGNDTEVLGGLAEGDTVVASGQFLIDSEASLKSALPKLDGGVGAAALASAAQGGDAQAAGRPAHAGDPETAADPADAGPEDEAGNEHEAHGAHDAGNEVQAADLTDSDAANPTHQTDPVAITTAPHTHNATGDHQAAPAAHANHDAHSPAPPQAAPTTWETTGRIEAVSAGSITLSHQPVPALGWGAMTMAFGKPSSAAFPDAKPGDAVRFAFRKTDGGYLLTKVEPAGGPR